MRRFILAVLVLLIPPLAAQTPPGVDRPLELRRLAPDVYAVLGHGEGAEGRPNAGFVVTREGVVAVGGLWSPAHARAFLAVVRRVTSQPLKWFVLYAHHPDMQFGTNVLREAGARVAAHPERHTLAAENGLDAMLADWDRVVGLQELIGFEYADVPDRPVTGVDTLRLGGVTMVLIHPGVAHSAGDLMLWLPQSRVLFPGDLILNDGVTMVVDGSSAGMLRALDLIDSLAPRVIVPGHGTIPPGGSDSLVARTRAYLTELRATMRDAVERGVPLGKATAALPPSDADRPVSRNSRRRRNAVRVYLEMEREVMGFPADSTRGGP
ncbi:MAG: MBL fold metallo-hydrolase [Gemmatimonadota bacterium]